MFFTHWINPLRSNSSSPQNLLALDGSWRGLPGRAKFNFQVPDQLSELDTDTHGKTRIGCTMGMCPALIPKLSTMSYGNVNMLVMVDEVFPKNQVVRKGEL